MSVEPYATDIVFFMNLTGNPKNPRIFLTIKICHNFGFLTFPKFGYLYIGISRIAAHDPSLIHAIHCVFA